jgi:replicative DNA helicase
MQVGTEICEAALRPGSREIGQIIDEAEGKVFALSERQHASGEGPKEISGLLSKVYERIDHLHNQDNPSDVTGVPTGLHRPRPHDVGLAADRPRHHRRAPEHGKDRDGAEHHRARRGEGAAAGRALLDGDERVAGDAAPALVDRQGRRAQAAHRAAVDEEWSSDLTEAMSTLHDAPIHIDQGGALTAMEVRARARRVKREYSKLGLVVVDYLQLMESRSQGEQRAQEVSEITRSLKALAKELEVPVIALSQLSREVDKRTNHRPVLSDLRESGSIEQDADLILFIYREEVYSPDAEDWKGIADVIVGKQRNGPVGDVRLTFLGRYTRFTNYANPGFGEPRRPQKAKVRNFNDYKAAAAGPDA